MGTINYNTSDYITLGLKPYSNYDLENDTELIKELEEYGESVEDYMQRCYEDDYSNIEYELKKYNFYYFHVEIEPGYYEGFALDIENNFSVAFDNYIDKREAQKEVTLLKQLLIDCAGLGLVQCFPGWCTGYSDYKTTIKAINAAIKEIREEIRNTPTWFYYENNIPCRKTA